MTGTLKAQLAQYGMTERLDEVLEECVRVRAEFGHPISATPFSQIVGIQAVLNIVTGDRYSMAPDEAVIYLMNAFGVPPAPVDENVRDKVLNSEHGRRFAGWERPQPSLSELRDQYGGPSLCGRGAAAALHGARRGPRGHPRRGPVAHGLPVHPARHGERHHRPLRRAVSGPGACG